MKRLIRKTENGVPIVSLLLYLISAYAVTLIILLMLALFLYKMDFSAHIVSGGVIFTYAGSTFFAGFLAGKKMKHKKFLWGIIMGFAYYLILVVLSLGMGQDSSNDVRNIFTTLVLCCGGGMLGGMLS